MVRHFVTPIKTQTPLKKILGLFHWVAHFTRNVRLFTARRTTTVTVYCWRLTGSSYCGGFWGGAVNPLQQILGLFHLEWLILVQIPLYFNRNVRQFTARTTTVTCDTCAANSIDRQLTIDPATHMGGGRQTMCAG